MKTKRVNYVYLSNRLCGIDKRIDASKIKITLLAPDSDGLLSRLRFFCKLIGALLFAKKVICASESVRFALHNYLNVSYSRLGLIYPGWEHIADVAEDENVFLKFEIKNPYFYVLYPKTSKWIQKIARNNPETLFVAAGKKIKTSRNIICIDKVTESENKALIKRCKAVLFPSNCDEAGNMPLAALACGAKVCAANIPGTPKIYGNSVHYFNLEDYLINLE
jgi:glycosyltransferase involved in cell wall biosynthesis